MNKAIRTYNLRTAVVMVMMAVLLLLVVALVLQPAAMTGDREGNPAIQAISADGTRGSGLATDPYIDRHAEVVARYHEGSLR